MYEHIIHNSMGLIHFQSDCLDFPARPDLMSLQPGALMEPSDPSYLQASRCTCLVELDGSAKKLPAAQCNGISYAFFCSAEVDVEILDLFAKSCFGNTWQDKLCSKSWFKARKSSVGLVEVV